VNTFIQIKQNQPQKSFVPLAYSGSGRPLLAALSDPNYQGFGLETAVLVGVPLTDADTVIQSGPLKRIINIYGSNDQFLNINKVPGEPDTDLPAIKKKFTHKQHYFDTINIELKGVKHSGQNGYFYSSAMGLSVKASEVIAGLTQAALDSEGLDRFLRNTFGDHDTEELIIDTDNYISNGLVKTYIVDLDLL